MATIVTRAGKGTPLTNTEVDANFTNLNTDKAELSGATFTGDVKLGDNDKATFGASDDLQIYHSGAHSFISDVGTGNLYLQAADSIILRTAGVNISATFTPTAGVDLNYTGSTKLATTATGIDVTGDVSLPDNGKATFGAGSDLQIFHNGTESFIREVGEGGLKIDSNGPEITLRVNATENALVAESNGAVTAYYNNVAKLATTSTGIDVTGTATMDGLVVSGTNGNSITQTHTDGNVVNFAQTGTGGTIDWRNANGGALIRTGDASRLLVGSNGDISFYEDTGTTAKLFWDASAESLGIGTSSPQAMLELSASNGGQTTPVTAANRLRFTDIDTGQVNGQPTGTIEWYTSDANSAGVHAYISTDMGNAGSGAMVFGNGAGGSATERMRIDSAGNVGIGTSSPSGAYAQPSLHIHASGNGAELHLTDGTTGATSSDGMSIFQYANDGYINMRENGSLRTYINGSERMRIDSAGRVGIGTSTPSAKLEINGGVGVATTGGTVVVRQDGDTNADGIALTSSNAISHRFWKDSGGKLNIGPSNLPSALVQDLAGNVGIGTSSPVSALDVTGAGTFGALSSKIKVGLNGDSISSDADFYIQTSTANPLILRTNFTERMRIDSAGRVGIGTSSPADLLDISANGTSVIRLSDSSSPATYAQITQANGVFTFAADAGNAQAGSNMQFEVDGSERMRIDSAGNVGIGTSTPTAPLSVLNAASTATTVQIGSSTLTHNTGIYLRTIGVAGLSWGQGGDLAFYGGGAGTTERMRIDSAGNMLVGKTSANNTTAGVTLYGSVAPGAASFVREAGNTLVLNRLTSDGEILAFRKDGTTVGSIGVALSDNLYFSGVDAGIGCGTGSIYPASTTGQASDNDTDLGTSSTRFKNLHLSGTAYVGTSVNSIGSAGGELYIAHNGSTDSGLRFRGGGEIIPANAGGSGTNGISNLGSAGFRFKDLYLSGGVYLGGTGAANKLEDYEEGTWTPTITGATSGSATLTVNQASYTKVGRAVHVSCYIINANVTGLVGTITVGGLPFTANGFAMTKSGYCTLFSFDQQTIEVAGYTENGQAYIRLQKGSSITGITGTDATAAGNGRIMMNFTYQTS